MGKAPRDGGTGVGEEGKGTQKELRCAVYTCQFPTMNVIIIHYKHGPIKITFKKSMRLITSICISILALFAHCNYPHKSKKFLFVKNDSDTKTTSNNVYQVNLRT